MNNPALPEISGMQAALSSAQELIKSLQHENKLLKQKLELFIKRYLGGKKNESIDPSQLELLLAGLLQEASVAPALVQTKPVVAPRKPAVRQPLPSHLPVERVIMEPEEVKAEPKLWRKIGEEVTEELDWKPAQFIKRLFIRPKYVKDDQVVIAPMPSRLIDKGLPGPGLLTHVILSKYEDHIPLYRQEKIFRERYKVQLSRQSLCDWVSQIAEWLKPVYGVMKENLLTSGYIQADETPIRYLDPDLPGKSQNGYLWTYSRPGGEVIFDWNVSRGREGPEKFLQSFNGLLQADGYGVYESLARDRKDWTLLGCMAHARRKFHDAMEHDRRAAWVLRQIGHLYAIEKALREKQAGPRLREAVRSSQAQPILNRIQKRLEKLRSHVLPESLLGKAITYANNQWDALCSYVKHGRAEIDNNLVENAIRPTAIGKKNFLFIGHPGAGWRSAVIYSILGSCRRLGVNPAEYLEDILRRLPDMKMSAVTTIAPQAWAEARKKHSSSRSA